MTYPMPGGAFPGRQWEAHVRRMVRDGCGREEIIYTMTRNPIPAIGRNIWKSIRVESNSPIFSGALRFLGGGASSRPVRYFSPSNLSSVGSLAFPQIS